MFNIQNSFFLSAEVSLRFTVCLLSVVPTGLASAIFPDVSRRFWHPPFFPDVSRRFWHPPIFPTFRVGLN